MSRFLVVSFAGLALAFYELSGGADFEPPRPPETGPSATIAATDPALARNRIETRPAETQARSPVLTPYRPTVIPASGAMPAGVAVVQAGAETAEVPAAQPTSLPTSLPTSAALRTTSVNSASSENAQLQVTLRQPVDPSPQADRLGLNLTATSIQIASLEGGLAAMTDAPAPVASVVAPAPEPFGEMRRIRASRANVRLGPGTQFPVMMQVLAGDEVRVLNEDPSGWALLEHPKTGQVGWIATSLLGTKGS
mgnify:CR=1 FL=1